MINKTAKLFETEMFRDQTMLGEIIDKMDARLFGELVKRKSEPLSKVMREGILESGIDWLNTGKPTGTSYCGYC
jgi:exocyst complex component 2